MLNAVLFILGWSVHNLKSLFGMAYYLMKYTWYKKRKNKRGEGAALLVYMNDYTHMDPRTV